MYTQPHFHHPKASLMPPSQSIFTSRRHPLICCLYRSVLLFLKFHMNGIRIWIYVLYILYIYPSVWLLSLGMMFLRFIHVHSSSLLLFHCIDTPNLFIHCPHDGYCVVSTLGLLCIALFLCLLMYRWGWALRTTDTPRKNFLWGGNYCSFLFLE